MGPFWASPSGGGRPPRAGDAGGYWDAGVKPSPPGAQRGTPEAQPLARWYLLCGSPVPAIRPPQAFALFELGRVGPLTGRVAGGQHWADEGTGVSEEPHLTPPSLWEEAAGSWALGVRGRPPAGGGTVGRAGAQVSDQARPEGKRQGGHGEFPSHTANPLDASGDPNTGWPSSQASS